MRLLPPTPMPSAIYGFNDGYYSGYVAVSSDGTVLASVDKNEHSVYLFSMPDCTVLAVVGTVGTCGKADGQLRNPSSAYFVHRNGVETLLICDSANFRVTEVTLGGKFIRSFAAGSEYGSGEFPIFVAYCSQRDVLAVSLGSSVIMLQYESAAVIPEFTISRGIGIGKINYALGIRFTLDGGHVVIADSVHGCVSQFSATSAAFVRHLFTGAYSRDVLPCADGSLVVATGLSGSAEIHVVMEGTTTQSMKIPSPPISLAYSPLLDGVIVQCLDTTVYLLRDEWTESSRCAWLRAIC